MLKWLLFVVALMFSTPTSDPHFLRQRLSEVQLDPVSPPCDSTYSASEFIYHDLTTELYKSAVRVELNATRDSKYAHLREANFEKCVILLSSLATAL